MAMRQRSKVKRPTDVFKQCPSCDSPNILNFESEVLCLYCDWTSIDVRVEARISVTAAEQNKNFGDLQTLAMGSTLRRYSDVEVA